MPKNKPKSKPSNKAKAEKKEMRIAKIRQNAMNSDYKPFAGVFFY